LYVFFVFFFSFWPPREFYYKKVPE
jgi:hypothetical protein